MKRSLNPNKFLSKKELSRVTAKIAGVEKLTSAEIKLILVRQCWADIRKKAHRIFKKYNLDQTAQRNCVLILIVTTNRQYIIYGDQGIHEKVGQDFWDEARNAMLNKFKQNEFGDGICTGIHLIGQKLAHIFPYQAGDENEISDNVEFEG